MAKLETYRKYFSNIHEKTPLSLFKNYIMNLIQLAEDQQKEIEMEKLASASAYQIDERPRYDVLEVKEIVIHTGEVAVIHYTNGTCQYVGDVSYSDSSLVVVEGEDN